MALGDVRDEERPIVARFGQSQEGPERIFRFNGYPLHSRSP